MAIADDFTVAQNGDIRYVGTAHGATTSGYHTVIAFHRWLQGLADDAVASATSSDFLDITDSTPSDRSTDNIITLINGYNIDDTAAEHLYDGSIIQLSGATIYDGLVVIANPGMNLQIAQNGAIVASDFWNYSVTGTHTGAANATVLTDSTKAWTTNQWAGYWIINTTDLSRGLIASNTATTITLNANGLMGGTENDFDASDAYKIVSGLNADTAQGLSHRFMLKVRSASADIDGRRIIGMTRVWSYTYSEFKVNGTSRGNNVLALTYASDLNNTTSLNSLVSAPFSSVTNVTAGYNGIDANNDATDEYYYSEWNKASCTINQFFERMKYLTRGWETATLYGLEGRLFRGITHEVTVTTPRTSTIAESALATWTGGSGQVLARDSAATATKVWIQLLTGVAPTAGQLITVGGGSVTAGAGTPSLERTLSQPFCGVSTGSALIGSYGFGIESTDLSASDKVFDLTNTQITPPNYVTFTVSGLYTDEDRVLVGPAVGGALQVAQYTLNGTLSADDVATIVVNQAIALDTPSSGTIRVVDNDGIHRRLSYSSWATSTFTITTTDGNEDFGASRADATTGNSVYTSYIDITADEAAIVATALAASTQYKIVTTGSTDFTLIGAADSNPGTIFTASGAGTGTGTAKPTAAVESFTAVYQSNRSLFVRVRDGGSTPIKTFESTATLGSGGGSASAIRTTDT